MSARTMALSPVVIYSLLLFSCVNWSPVNSRELDAQLVKPIGDVVKSAVNTVTTGQALDISFNPVDFARDLVILSWQNGFPVTMPANARERAQQFYDRVKSRVSDANVEGVARKSLAGLKEDLDGIVDSVINEIRVSPDGIYTDLTKTMVNGVPLEDAMVSVGQQLKAYGVDLSNYRNIAQMVLGIPVVPHVASTVMGVTKQVPSLPSLSMLTSQLPSMRGIRDRIAMRPSTNSVVMPQTQQQMRR